jgi:redox-sensitive bicupin YhaK (pirin superfamily)
MIQQSKAKMFLADERGLNQNEWFRSFNTFNFGKYFNEHKHPFGDIYVVNDDTLDAGRSLKMLIEEYSYIILLPVIGAIAYKDTSGNDNLIAAGQVEILMVDKGETIEISNPFDEGLVNFLQIWIKADIIKATKGSYLSTYNVNKCLNGLLKISPSSLGTSSLPFSVSIGKFDGRGETTYHAKNMETGLFVFVIEGAFEVEGRLLHARDSLALWETESAEMEALSNDAILMIVELPL